jgi:hypothetical protein
MLVVANWERGERQCDKTDDVVIEEGGWIEENV